MQDPKAFKAVFAGISISMISYLLIFVVVIDAYGRGSAIAHMASRIGIDRVKWRVSLSV